MERLLPKKNQRIMGLIVCAALIIAVVFQNDALVNAEENEAGEGTQDNLFYLNGITVTADYEPELLEGHVLSDGEHEYVIDSEGKIQFDENYMTVSGGDMGSASGCDVGSVSGCDEGNLSTNPDYFYVKSDKGQLELTYVETDAFFGMDAPVILQPNTPEGTYIIMLDRKFELARPAVRLVKGEGTLIELAEDSYTYHYVDSENIPVTAPVRAGKYKAAVIWMGITSSVSYDCTGADAPVVEYRDHIIYGRDGDFYITAVEDGQEKIVEALTEGRSYSVRSIVIKGREIHNNENPFNYYKIKDGEGNVLDEGYVGSQDTVINSIAHENGIISISMYIRNDNGEHEASNVVSLTADNSAPELISLTYLTGSDEKKGEAPRPITIGANGSLQFTDADTIMDQETVTLYLTVSEASGIREASISYLSDGSETPESDVVMLTESDNQSGLYTGSYTIMGNVNLTRIQLTVSDIRSNQAAWGTLSAIVDNTAPFLKDVRWIPDDEGNGDSAEKIDGQRILAKESIQLLFTINEKNALGEVNLHFTKDGQEEEVIASIVSDSGLAEYDNRTYVYSCVISGQGSYKDFCLEMADALGNYKSNVFTWDAVIDNTPPEIREVFWMSDESSDLEAISGNALLVDKAEITLIMTVEEKNVRKAELYLLENIGQNAAPIGTFQQDKDCAQRYTLTVNKAAYNYKNLILQVTDESGNSTIYGDKDNEVLRIIIDGEAPQLKNLQQLYPQENAWYHSQSDAIQYSFDLKDYSGIKSIRMVAKPKSGEQIVWDLTDDYKEVLERDEQGYFTYHITTDTGRFISAADQELEYFFVIEDELGNSVNTSEVRTPITAEMCVDNTAPSDRAYIKFQGDLDKFYNTLDELVNADGKPYLYGSQSGKLFNKSEVELTVYVADQVSDHAVDQAASGIWQVKVTYRYTDISISGAKDQTRVLIFGEGGDSRGIREKVHLIAEGKDMLMDAVSFTLTVTDSQQITALDSIEITDRAGNVTVIREYASANGLAVDYVLDNKAPELSHVIPAGSSDYTEDGNTYYYNSAAEMSVTITENNFYPAEVYSSLRVGEADRTIAMSGFQNTGNYCYRSRFTMNEGDGRYQFSLSYTDRSDNNMIFPDGGTYMSGGTYTSPILVLDTVAPNISIRYYQGGNDITGSVTEGRCINGGVSAVISVTETNFDPRLVQIAFSATDASDNHAYNIGYDPDGWRQSGNTYSYTISCTSEGHYSLTASCVDKAGNVSNNVPVSDFIVDMTAPVVAISYDTTVENAYYDTDRVATVTVIEQNFDEEAADYVITSTGVQPGITNWTHTAGNGCSEADHVKDCRWYSRVVFDEDADYSFTFGCVDKAGNTSVPIEKQEFIIDQTRPVIRVSYDNNEPLNSHFYKEGRTATVTVIEHNFMGSEVNLIVNSPDGEIPGPSAWRASGADTYVCQITYDTDGDYTFDISYVDPAGNAAEAYAGDRFVVDMTAPELEISGVNDRSANNGVVAPVITCSDKNYDAEEVTIRIIGINHGQITPEHTITTNEDGQTITFMDFSHVQELDDLYTLEAVITDKAGNSTMDSILFSVNRFGSAYLFSQETQELLDRYYINQGPLLVITEINVDTLEHQEISYSCDGNTVVLEQGIDYTVQESGGEYEWKQYTYEIPGSNFDTEGVYVVTLQSVDRASNDITNRIKEKNIEFTVDKTAPSVVLGGIENGGSYAETARSLTIDAVDNIYLKSVDIYLNSQLATSFDEDTLSEYHGVVSYEIKETGSVQTVYVIARDAAGNETKTDAISFLISSSAFIRWLYNRPLFFSSIAAVAALAGSIVTVVFVRRKKRSAGNRTV